MYDIAGNKKNSESKIQSVWSFSERYTCSQTLSIPVLYKGHYDILERGTVTSQYREF